MSDVDNQTLNANNITVPLVYAPLFQDDYKRFILSSGRISGKTSMLVCLWWVFANKYPNQDIATGKTKTLEKTTVRDRDGNIKEERIVEKEPSIADRMVARAKLDGILGITDMTSAIGQVQAGQITVTIVDASNKQQKQDKRNDVVIDADFTETMKQQQEGGEQDEE